MASSSVRAGEIRITGARQDDQIVVRVADDGVGLPDGFSLETAEGLGLQLVRTLVGSDLRGSATMYMIEGDPDARSDEHEPAEATPASEATPRRWTVTELRFPAVAVALGAPETARIEAGGAGAIELGGRAGDYGWTAVRACATRSLPAQAGSRRLRRRNPRPRRTAFVARRPRRGFSRPSLLRAPDSRGLRG